MTSTETATAALARLLAGFSLEMTGKDVADVAAMAELAPAGTRVNVTYLENETSAERLAAVRAIRAAGLVPVPHLAARRLPSRAALEEYLDALRAEDGIDEVFVVGGDPATPQGPYEDALSVIRSGWLQGYGVARASIAGYPEGHPAISAEALWEALDAKAAALAFGGVAGDVVTQFGFDAEAVATWIEQVRERGVTMPIRVGVPGPAGIKRLVRYAARFGVGTSAGIARKYGFSLTNLMGTAGPDRFLRELAGRIDEGRHGEVKVHFYTFGGLRNTSAWIADFKEREGA